MTLQKNQVVAQSASPKQTFSSFLIRDILGDDRPLQQQKGASPMEVEEPASPLTASSESDDDQRSDSSLHSTESKSECSGELLAASVCAGGGACVHT